jgi:hypothetical protein
MSTSVLLCNLGCICQMNGLVSAAKVLGEFEGRVEKAVKILSHRIPYQ